jgi:hypothetical protein
MGGDDDGIRVPRPQRVHPVPVLRCLEVPLPGCPGLEQLQHPLVVAVRRREVGAHHPLEVARQEEHRREDQAVGLVGEQGDALDRSLGRVVVHRLEPGDAPALVGFARGQVPVVAPVRVRRRRRHGVDRLPSAQRAKRGVLAEQVAERGRARARHPDDDDRTLDALLAELRVVPPPRLHPKPVHQRRHDEVLGHGAAGRAERRLLLQTVDQSGQALTEGGTAEVVHADARRGLFEQLLAAQRRAHRREVPSAAAPRTSVSGRSGAASGYRYRKIITP